MIRKNRGSHLRLVVSPTALQRALHTDVRWVHGREVVIFFYDVSLTKRVFTIVDVPEEEADDHATFQHLRPLEVLGYIPPNQRMHKPRYVHVDWTLEDDKDPLNGLKRVLNEDPNFRWLSRIRRARELRRIREDGYRYEPLRTARRSHLCLA